MREVCLSIKGYFFGCWLWLLRWRTRIFISPQFAKIVFDTKLANCIWYKFFKQYLIKNANRIWYKIWKPYLIQNGVFCYYNLMIREVRWPMSWWPLSTTLPLPFEKEFNYHDDDDDDYDNDDVFRERGLGELAAIPGCRPQPPRTCYNQPHDTQQFDNVHDNQQDNDHDNQQENDNQPHDIQQFNNVHDNQQDNDNQPHDYQCRPQPPRIFSVGLRTIIGHMILSRIINRIRAAPLYSFF